MPKTALPTVTFEIGQCLRRHLPASYGPGQVRPVDAWTVIGRLGTGEPFCLFYQGLGLTQWHSPTHLGDSLRKKILDHLREQVRDAATPPAFITVHDLRALDDRTLTEGNAEAGRLSQAFFDDVWRAEYLHDRDADWIELDVPYVERQQASDLGALWHPGRRKWRVHKSQDLSAFARWASTAA